MSHSNSASAGSNAGAGVGSFVGGLFNPTVGGSQAPPQITSPGVVKTNPSATSSTDPNSPNADWTNYQTWVNAMTTSSFLADNTPTAVGQAVAGDTSAAPGSIGAQAATATQGLTAWIAQNAVVIAVVAGAALVGVIAITSMFNNSSESGTTHIVPVPV